MYKNCFPLPRLYDGSHLELVKHRSLNIQTVSSLLYCSFTCIKRDLAPVKIEISQSLVFVQLLFHVWIKHDLATLPINQSHSFMHRNAWIWQLCPCSHYYHGTVRVTESVIAKLSVCLTECDAKTVWGLLNDTFCDIRRQSLHKKP